MTELVRSSRLASPPEEVDGTTEGLGLLRVLAPGAALETDVSPLPEGGTRVTDRVTLTRPLLRLGADAALRRRHERLLRRFGLQP